MLVREGATGSVGGIRRPATASAMMQRPFGTGRSLGAEPPPEARVLAKLEPGDVFGGGSLLLGDEEVPDRLGVLAASDVKLYAVAAADLQRRGTPELWRQIKEEVGSIARRCHPLHRPGCTGAGQTHVTPHALSGNAPACCQLRCAPHQSLPRHEPSPPRSAQMPFEQFLPVPSARSRPAFSE